MVHMAIPTQLLFANIHTERYQRYYNAESLITSGVGTNYGHYTLRPPTFERSSAGPHYLQLFPFDSSEPWQKVCVYLCWIIVLGTMPCIL
jgi:hypothetical protein